MLEQSNSNNRVLASERKVYAAEMGKTRQVAALPVQFEQDGALRVMLVTSRETRRYVIPKGWPWPGLKAHKAAAKEAREEAGIVGRIGKKSIGAYTYVKRLTSSETPVRVRVFLMSVDQLLDTWPEQDQRKREWFTPTAAAAAVDEPELAEIIRKLDEPNSIHVGRLKIAGQ